MLKWVLTLVLIAALWAQPWAQITTPHVFITSVPVSQLNTNFSTLGSGALNRAGGTITGNITVNSGVTIDGVDISAQLSGTGTPTFAGVTITGTGASALDVAGGINAGTGNVGIVDSTGKIPALTSTYVSNLSGANLTNLSFSQLTTTTTAVAYSAGNFTANGSMTWTVADVDETVRYVEFGKMMYILFDIRNATVGGTVNSALWMTVPNGRSCSYGQGTFAYSDAGTGGNGWVQANGTRLEFYKTILTPNWTAGTDNNFVIGHVWCEIA